LLPLGAFVIADATLILSPVLFAADFLSFPFVVGSFIQLALIDRWLAWRRGDVARPRAPESTA
jgi:hypothetical protein